MSYYDPWHGGYDEGKAEGRMDENFFMRKAIEAYLQKKHPRINVENFITSVCLEKDRLEKGW